MTRFRLAVLTAVAMLAFAGNSLLCRFALLHTKIDPVGFTAIRILSGALALLLILRLRSAGLRRGGSWASALALFVYAAGFSLAYVSLSAATGALLLFGAVQATMIGYGHYAGERLRLRQWLGFGLALVGLIGLLLPGLTAPAPRGAALMLAAGVAWGVYSLRSRGAGDPHAVTAGNFLRAVPLALGLALAYWPSLSISLPGATLAIASGALASGVGYAIWYSALQDLRASSAASVQLSVPLITALGAVALLDEPFTVRLMLATLAILGGVALVIATRGKQTSQLAVENSPR